MAPEAAPAATLGPPRHYPLLRQPPSARYPDLPRSSVSVPRSSTCSQHQSALVSQILDFGLLGRRQHHRTGRRTVYKGVMPSGEIVAVKRLAGEGKGASHDHGFSAEIQIRHCNIVRLLGCCSNHETNLLVCEYMPNGSLGDLLHSKDSQFVNLDRNTYMVRTPHAPIDIFFPSSSGFYNIITWGHDL